MEGDKMQKMRESVCFGFDRLSLAGRIPPTTNTHLNSTKQKMVAILEVSAWLSVFTGIKLFCNFGGRYFFVKFLR